MDINFGSNKSNCHIIFDLNGNYGVSNNNMYIYGNNWNGMAYFPNGIDFARVTYSYNLNKMVKIPNSVTNMFRGFFYCSSFNQNVQIPDSVLMMDTAFADCYNLNQNIKIPNGVNSINNLFQNCYKLNQAIQIPNSVIYMSSTFCNCKALNQNIKLSNNVKYLTNTFYGCINLNQNIQIPNSVTSMSGTFYGCNNLNQNIKLPNGATSIINIFAECSNLKQNIYIPNSIIGSKANWAFRNCNLLSDVSIGIGINNGIFTGAFSPNNSHVRNIWTDTTTASNLITTNIIHPINGSTSTSYQIRPTWTTVTNGYYNSYYNMYIYTNAF